MFLNDKDEDVPGKKLNNDGSGDKYNVQDVAEVLD